MTSDRTSSLVSLFAGAGGLDAGLERAGFRTRSALDADADCIATLEEVREARLPLGEGRTILQGATLLHRRIEETSAADLWTGSDPPDLLAGGPPCQPFSSAGAMRSVEEERGRLYEHFVRLTGELRPRLVLFENVRGLVTAKGPSGQPGQAFRMVKEAFEGVGYATRFALLNAADFGCPQRRVRCFMIGARAGALPLFPEPTHAQRPEGGLFDARLPWVSLGAFLETVPSPGKDEVIVPSTELRKALAGLGPGTGVKSAGAREATRPGGHWGYRQGTFLADPALPARTVTASASQDWIRLPDGSHRRLTWRECAGLQGFPTEWPFQGGTASRFRQIGNAVPVPLAEALGRCLLKALAGRSEDRPTSAPLPREFLAAMDYTRKEQARNGASRARVIRLERDGKAARSALKGLGSAEPRRD